VVTGIGQIQIKATAKAAAKSKTEESLALKQEGQKTSLAVSQPAQRTIDERQPKKGPNAVGK
jgi:hypothetical protein